MARRRMTYIEKVNSQGLLSVLTQRQTRKASFESKAAKLRLELAALEAEENADVKEYEDCIKNVDANTLAKLNSAIEAQKQAENAAKKLVAETKAAAEAAAEAATVVETPASEVEVVTVSTETAATF